MWGEVFFRNLCKQKKLLLTETTEDEEEEVEVNEKGKVTT